MAQILPEISSLLQPTPHPRPLSSCPFFPPTLTPFVCLLPPLTCRTGSAANNGERQLLEEVRGLELRLSAAQVRLARYERTFQILADAQGSRAGPWMTTVCA